MIGAAIPRPDPARVAQPRLNLVEVVLPRPDLGCGGGLAKSGCSAKSGLGTSTLIVMKLTFHDTNHLKTKVISVYL